MTVGWVMGIGLLAGLGARDPSRPAQILSALVGAGAVLLLVHIVASRHQIFARRRWLWRGHLTKRGFRI